MHFLHHPFYFALMIESRTCRPYHSSYFLSFSLLPNTDHDSIVERLPIIMKEPEAWEVAYMEMQEEIMKHGKVRLYNRRSFLSSPFFFSSL